MDYVGCNVPNLATPGLTANSWAVKNVESKNITSVVGDCDGLPMPGKHIAVGGYSSNCYRNLASGNPLLENARAAAPHTDERAADVVVGALRSELQYRIEGVR